MKKKLSLWLLSLLTVIGGARADEGMWTLNNLSPKTMQTMKELGLKLSATELYNPDGASLKDAVVVFGGFCTGVVVSPDGLVFTNHHCGFGSIQKLATPQNDILYKGFVAQTQQDELPAEDLFVSFLQRTEDVTTEVNKALEELYKQHPEAEKTYGKDWKMELKRQHIGRICADIEERYTPEDTTLTIEVLPYYKGNAYYLNYYKIFDDVRLVFAPPQSLGKFGGETDNWMWPRQTCDFSVFRIYADENNQPAPYSPTNKPYRPETYARISTEGYDKGDFCMTLGYPGSTERYLSSFGIREQTRTSNPARINVRGIKQDIWKKWMDSDPAIRLQYAAKYAQSSNYWKNSMGMNLAIERLGVVKNKREIEKDLKKWYNQSPDNRQLFGSVLPNLKKAYGQREADRRAYFFLTETFFNGSEILRLAGMYERYITAKSKEQKQELSVLIKEFLKDYNAQVDKETTAALLNNYRKEVKSKYWPDFYETVKKEYGNSCQEFTNTLFANADFLHADFIDSGKADSTLLDHPAFKTFKSVSNFRNKMAMQSKKTNDAVTDNESLLCRAILEKNFDSPLYSDANFTLRLSYGYINDYANDGVEYSHYTTSPELLAKNDKAAQEKDYELLPGVREVFETGDFGPYADRRNGKLQLCFLTNNDITGGNSGSPMFNGKGELIGLAFDGNWDALSSDISFTQELTRCIGVDIRYVLFVMDRWGKADRLIKELGVR